MARRRLYGKDIAVVLGISQPQASARVRGSIAWSFDELDMVADYYGCSVFDLLPRRDSNLEPSDNWTDYATQTDYTEAA